jgi:hydroxymethylpyrimidine pyrophosphatase-like HAD family hydrolase
MPNDLPMLQWAGRGVAVANAHPEVLVLQWAGRGVAVANAHPEVLAAADEVAPSNQEDGVAAILGRLVDQGASGRR